MKKLLVLALAVALVVGVMPVLAQGPAVKHYGDNPLSGGFQAGHFPQV